MNATTRAIAPASVLIAKALGIPKGSATPNTAKVGKVTRKQLEDIAKVKMPDLTAGGLDAAVRGAPVAQHHPEGDEEQDCGDREEGDHNDGAGSHFGSLNSLRVVNRWCGLRWGARQRSRCAANVCGHIRYR